MNTVKKGDKLEEQIFYLLRDEIKHDRFIARKDLCRIFKKKGYYSKDREKNIIFDISVEIYLPGQETYSILVLIECKNYNHKVPVDDVEEFFQKTQQVSGANVKGIVISTNSYQEGAFNFSKSKGLGLARYVPSESLSWVLTRSPSNLAYTNSNDNYTAAYQGLRSDHLNKVFFDFFGTIGETYSTSIHTIFSTLLITVNDEIRRNIEQLSNNKQSVQTLVEYLSKDKIEEIATKVLGAINYSGGLVDLDHIGDYLSESFGLKLKLNERLSKNVLGSIQFNPLVICVDSDKASELSRIRFTLAHEYGHYFLEHSKYLISESCYDSVVDKASFADFGIKDIVRMEWQANHFASSLLLPRKFIINEFLSLAKKNGLVDRGHGYLYLDNQKCNLDNYYNITSPLMKKFKVSRQAIKYRLIGLGLLNDESSTKKSTLHFSERLI